MIREVLEHTGLGAKYLTLEITESIIILNSERAKDTLSRLKNLGVNIAIDDFGTGYSSLSYLKNFPVDKLKIDKSFVKDIPAKNEDVAIIDTIITLGHNLKIKVIAEGVETLPQLELLQKLGCDEVQEVWNKFKQNKLAFGALYFLVLLALAAIYAPLIGNNKPLIIHTSHDLIFRDYLDSAEGTLVSILEQLKEGKAVSSKNARWLSESTRQTALFLEDVKLADELRSLDSLRAIGRNDQLSLKKLADLLGKASKAAIKKRTFFPLFRSLEAADIFFMLIPLFLLLLKILKPHITKLKTASFWDRLAAAVLLSLVFGFLIATIKPERFDAYHYKKMANQFDGPFSLWWPMEKMRILFWRLPKRLPICFPKMSENPNRIFIFWARIPMGGMYW
jgi:hypothetical protein